MKAIDLHGIRFGRLVALHPSKNVGKKTTWKCVCDCGNEHIVRTCDLRGGKVISCGCYNNEQYSIKSKTHGCTGSRLYNIWSNMIQRCTNPNRSDFYRYGHRGIRVYSKWRNFEAFKAWAITAGYRDWLYLERTNNDGDYCPENCVWATAAEQSRNTSRTVKITYSGETHCLKDWASILGINYQTLHSAIRRGKSFEEYVRREP